MCPDAVKPWQPRSEKFLHKRLLSSKGIDFSWNMFVNVNQYKYFNYPFTELIHMPEYGLFQ
jgi:hypothetical protein